MSDNAAFYEGFALSYEGQYRAVDAPSAVQQWLGRMEILELVPNQIARRKQPVALLDLGCGPGWHLREWAAEGFSVAGLDVSPTMLRLAQRNWDAQFKAAIPQLFCADIRQPSQMERLHGAYDLVVAHFNFLNLFAPVDLQHVFTSISALLASGGIFATDLALRAEIAESPSNPAESVPQRLRHWSLPSGELVETYWFHSLESVTNVSADHQLSMVDIAAWLAGTAPPYFAPLAQETSKAWLALRKS